MSPTICVHCKVSRALVIRPKNREKLCQTCFFDAFETEIHNTVISNSLFRRGERIAIGASGGKDSTVLASVLRTLNERHDYGLDFVLLSIDEGIKGYRDDSLETVKNNSKQYGMPLEILGYDELYGWTMDQVVQQVGKKGNCTYCGVFRRQALDRGAAKLGINHVVTGHNADDICETVLLNLLRGDLPRLARTTSIVTASAASDIKRSKPLKYAYEKEIVLYAHHKGLEYFSTECIYSPEAFRGSARTLVKDLERIRPSAILDIVRSGEDMAKLVPPEVSGQRRNGPKDILVIEGEEDSAGGCGSANGRTSGGEMAQMEALLRENEKSASLETDLASPAVINKGQNHDRKKPQPQKAKSRNVKKMPTQQMSRCERCGYLSSQAVCKACMLLEGLNKNRPKTEILVGADEEEESPTLTRRMEGLKLGEYGRYESQNSE